MSIPAEINLASQPFRRERAQNAIIAAVCVALTCSLFVLVGLFLHERAQAGDLRNVIENQNSRLHALQRQQAQFSRVLAKPENADVFATNVFLNELIARRGVSWTRVFSDLGTVLPENMRLLGIRLPQVGEDSTGTNRVQLDMIVATEKSEAVIGLLKNLEGSPLFGSASVVTQTPPSQNDPFYKYRVTVAYAQKL
jgi:Tfp pilus assembly protein PilN